MRLFSVLFLIFLSSIAMADGPILSRSLIGLTAQIYPWPKNLDGVTVNSMTSDPYGFIYITGSTRVPVLSAPTYFQDDLIVMKINQTTGAVAWSQTFGVSNTENPDSGTDILWKNGLIYVTGNVQEGVRPPNMGPQSAYYTDSFVMKFNAQTGSMLWQTRHDTQVVIQQSSTTYLQSTNDSSKKIIVDSFGRSYVLAIAGMYFRSSSVPEGIFQWEIFSFDANGNLLWERSENGTSLGMGSGTSDVPADLLFGPQGDLIVAGTVENLPTGLDIRVVRYNLATGDDLMRTDLDLSSNGLAHFGITSAMAVNSSGIYLTGLGVIGNSNSLNILTLKLDYNLNELWSSLSSETNIMGHISGGSIKVAASGNVYVNASVELSHTIGTPNMDQILYKYSANGTLVWSKTYNGSSNIADYASKLILDTAENIYSIGKANFQNSLNQSDISVLKYNSNGVSLTGSTVFDGPLSKKDISTCAILNSTGSVFVSGITDQTGYTSANSVILKFNMPIYNILTK